MTRRFSHRNLLSFSIVLILLLFVLPFRLFAQVPPADAVRGLVQQYMNQLLGREAVVIEFDFEGVTWESSALGCPHEDESYDSTPLAGYRWTLLMDDGVRYAVHSDAFGRQIVLCPEQSQAVVSFSVFQNDLFSIQHPNLWTARASLATNVLFLFRGQDSCNFPRMQVFVTANNDPEDLMESLLSSVGVPADPSQYTAFRATGFSTLYQTQCGEILHTGRATTISPTADSGYLIVQSAPAQLFDIWSPVFLEILNSFSPAGIPAPATATPSPLDTPAPVTAIVAPNATPVPSTEVAEVSPATAVPDSPPSTTIDMENIPLAHVFIGDVYIGRLNDIPGTGITSNGSQINHWHLTPSADGRQLAYIES
ncbi:MAG TPA: hypothetical protein VJZ27_16700, partial [Aggregatilineales bacterium]|nr:hypothetical protein [Aggregatilineales bacterium]